MPGLSRVVVAAVLVVLAPLVRWPDGQAAAQVVLAQVPASAETAAVRGNGDDADDPAIWLHPADPSLSLVIGSNKSESSGGLHVYDLDGAELQYLPTGAMNSVDLRVGARLGNATVDLVASSNRTTNALEFFRINAADRRLEPAGSVAAASPSIYGLCLYRAPSGPLYAYATYKSGLVEQYLLDTSSGQVTGTPMRSFDVGSQAEGCVTDDTGGWLYVGEESQGIWKYAADPQGSSDRTLVDGTAAGGHLRADVEGIALYASSAEGGYLLVSSQGDSTVAVYDRGGANAYRGSFTVGGGGEVDAVTSTDGLDVTSAGLGPAFPGGLLVLHDANNQGDTASNYKLVPWERIVGAVGLSSASEAADCRLHHRKRAAHAQR